MSFDGVRCSTVVMEEQPQICVCGVKAEDVVKCVQTSWRG